MDSILKQAKEGFSGGATSRLAMAWQTVEFTRTGGKIFDQQLFFLSVDQDKTNVGTKDEWI